MNHSIKIFMATALLFATASLAGKSAFAQASATVGGIRGVVRDTGSKEVAAGATVVATSPALQGQQVVITDDKGQYFVTALPPGVYAIAVYYGDATFVRGNVLIQAGKEAVINVDVDSRPSGGRPSKKGEIIEITGAAPIIDQGSTKTGATFGEDYTDNIPSPRTFGGVIGSAGGAQRDFSEKGEGVSIAGATSLENTYIVEGINTTDTGYGGLSANLPNEFVRETDVITGGYNAEYGRSTGGIVNVVTKSGSNQFHGSVFGYWQPGRLVSTAKNVESEGGSIARRSDLDYRYDVGAEVGGPIVKDKLWFHIGINPSIQRSTVTRTVQSQRDQNQDGIPDVDPNTGFAQHEFVSESAFPTTSKTYYFTAKLSGAINQNHQFQLSAFGNPNYDRLATPNLVRNPQFVDAVQSNNGSYSLSGKWTSKFNDGKTQVDAVAGLHRGIIRDSLRGSAFNVPEVVYGYERSLYDFADLEGAGAIAACRDNVAGDKYPGVRNCPVTEYTEAGLGYLERSNRDRASGILSITQRVQAAGTHVFRAGVDAEFSTYNAQKSFTGGASLRRFSNSDDGAPGVWGDRQYLDVLRNLTPQELMDPGSVTLGPNQTLCANDRAICQFVSQISADTNSTSLGAFIQDSWQILPNLTINAGLRYENQIGYASKQLQGQVTPDGEIVPKRVFNLNDLWAPRAGFLFDPTQEGRSKIFGHWGRFYENIPMDLLVRNFGGEYINFSSINTNSHKPGDAGYDPNCDLDHNGANVNIATLRSCSDSEGAGQTGGPAVFIAPGLRGQYTDEVVLGSEYEVMQDLKLGLSYIHRSLPSVIEDVSTDGGNTYLITNPGRDFSEAAAQLQRQAMTELASSDPAVQALGRLHQSRAEQLAFSKQLATPTRNYDAIQIVATQRPTKRSLILASYTYSMSRGNYPGLFSTETGQADPNNTSLYDLPDLMANRYGPMGLDRPHNLKIDGFYRFDLKAAGLVTAGGSFRAQSGIAHNALGATPHPGYGPGESFLLPRGSILRSPVTSQVDVHLSYGYRLSRGTVLEGFCNVFNLFNQQDQLNTDDTYTLDVVNPIVGGTMSDLQHAKIVDQRGVEVNRSPTLNRNFGQTATGARGLGGPALQAPRSFQVGMRLRF